MQKLDRRDTYTPTGAPQARCNCDLLLNNPLGEMDSVIDLKTFSNSSDVDLPRLKKRERRDLRVPVYVLNMRGEPLMPITPRKARILLKEKKAKVRDRTPFTIQLNYSTGESKQSIILGIDSGYSFIGFSANTEKRELISGEVELRKNISKLITTKSMYRRNRRNRLWYRKPRFLNREKCKGWLAPSIQHKLDTHLRFIKKIEKILPITKTIVEIANFDTQKMQNPEIKGVEYQQGELWGYELREYLLEKWGRKCAYCKKTNIPLEIEHIIPKSRGGSNRVSNLTLSCRECNQKKGDMTAKEFGYSRVQGKAKQSLKSTPFMNLVRTRIVDLLKCEKTYGYITKHDRIKLGLKKSHVNDAFVIARGVNQERCIPYIVKQIRRNNRSIQLNRKGFKPSIRKKRYKLQPFDLIKNNNILYRSAGTSSYGRYVLINDLNGKPILNNKKKRIYFKTNNMELIQYGKGLQFIKKESKKKK